jgi:hypothetical protein
MPVKYGLTPEGENILISLLKKVPGRIFGPKSAGMIAEEFGKLHRPRNVILFMQLQSCRR